MMVITGPDGSGKSTLLDKIVDAEINHPILKVPHTEPDKFNGNKEIEAVCKFINELGKIADIEKSPSLKILSMFSAMLVFENLYNMLKQPDKAVICERHPLVDTGVYAKVYFSYMDPALLNLKLAGYVESNYINELGYILGKINRPIEKSGQGLCFDLLKFLHNWFSDEINYLPINLMQLFSVKMPEKIILLDAPSKILAKRIALRNRREFHENENILEKMRLYYRSALANLGMPYEIVDTQDFRNSDFVVERLMDM